MLLHFYRLFCREFTHFFGVLCTRAYRFGVQLLAVFGGSVYIASFGGSVYIASYGGFIFIHLFHC